MSELICATFEGDLQRVKDLLDSGADPNESVEEEHSALVWAATLGRPELIDVLLRARADPNRMDSTGTWPLVRAVGASTPTRARCVELLLEACGRVPDVVGAEALASAAFSGDAGVVKQLLDAGVQPNSRALDEDGERYALIAAAAGGHLEVMRLLLERGADPAVASADGRTALHVCAERVDDPRLVNLLVEAGCPVDGFREPVGEPQAATPLMMAVATARYEMVTALLGRGANAVLEHPDCGTAIDLAERTKSPDQGRILDVLRRAAGVGETR